MQATIDPEAIQQACTFACGCNVSDITLDSSVSCDFSSLMSATVTSAQTQSTLETVWQMMSIEDKLPVIDMANSASVFESTSTTLLDICRSDTFQVSVQDLKATQYVALRGVGTIHGVTIREAIHAVEDIIQSNQAASNMVTDFHTEMLTIVSQLIRVSSFSLIEWIVRIALYLVVFILLGIVIRSTISLGKTALLVS
jgi:hypothetical protein